MATRSLTSVFIMMRNNALQNKNLQGGPRGDGYYDYDDDDDTVALVGTGKQKYKKLKQTEIQIEKPAFVEWAEKMNMIKFECDQITDKMIEMEEIHGSLLRRPGFSDDKNEEEEKVERMTREITQIFFRCKNTVKVMEQRKRNLQPHEQTLAQNMLSSIVSKLQELSTEFRKCQSKYLDKIKSREEKSHQFFSDVDHDLMIGQEEDDEIDDIMFQRGINTQIVDKNTKLIETRETEIQSVVRSITELSEIFQDLGSLITEQSGIIDRIDYNIENTVVQTEKGLDELKKAENYQKKSNKMMIIFVMAIILVVMFLTLVISKS